MKRVELLIDEVRRQTGNERYSDTTNAGVSQNQMVRNFKNAQDSLYKHIVNAKTMVYSKEKIISIVSGQDLYSYPVDIYLQNIETMQWRYNSSQTQDYINLSVAYTKDRVTSMNGYPFAYLVRGDGFLLVPPVNTGALRCTYIRKLPEPEKRSGRISAITSASGLITAMTLNTAEASFDPTYLNQLQALCAVDKYGRSVSLGIEIDSVNAGTGAVTFSTPQAPALGVVPAVGDYVTAGYWTYNCPDMPDICESHLIKHSIYEVRYGDMSNWTKAALDDLNMSLQTILDSFKNPEHDITEVLISNCDYIDHTL